MNSYKLDYWALSYDNTGTLNAKVNIKEAVKLNHNASGYAGTFSIQAYDPNTGDPLGGKPMEILRQRASRSTEPDLAPDRA